MIFGAKNENGKSTFELVLEKRKTVTRRNSEGRTYFIGKDYAVQYGRGKTSAGRIKIISSQSHYDWWKNNIERLSEKERNEALNNEAHKEGFNSWDGLIKYFIKNNIHMLTLTRYEFELVNNRSYNAYL